MRMIWMLVLLAATMLPSSALAVPYTVKWTLPTLISGLVDAAGQPATAPLPPANIVRVNMYCKALPGAPAYTSARTALGAATSLLVDFTGPETCAFTVVATAPNGEFVGQRESDFGPEVTYALELTNPKIKPASFGAGATASAKPITECLPAGSKCVLVTAP